LSLVRDVPDGVAGGVGAAVGAHAAVEGVVVAARRVAAAAAAGFAVVADDGDQFWRNLLLRFDEMFRLSRIPS
jgi:hypothetical protein